MEQTADPLLLSRAFELRLLRYLGYNPVLDRCVRCQERAVEALAGFAPGEGGMLCRSCAGVEGERLIPVGPPALAALRDLGGTDLRVVARRPVDPALGNELGRLLFAFIQWRAEKPLKSLAFLQSLLVGS